MHLFVPPSLSHRMRTLWVAVDAIGAIGASDINDVKPPTAGHVGCVPHVQHVQCLQTASLTKHSCCVSLILTQNLPPLSESWILFEIPAHQTRKRPGLLDYWSLLDPEPREIRESMILRFLYDRNF